MTWAQIERGRFNNKFSVRLFDDIKARITIAVKENPDMYENESHFVRVAVMRLLNQIETQKKEKKEL